MNIKKTILVLIILTSMLWAKIPKWVTTGTHSKYSSKEYFLGVGISKERTQSEELARSNLIKQISVQIESKLENTEQEIRNNDKIKTLSDTKINIISKVSADISGIEIVEIKKHKKNYYALAVLNKYKYLKTLETKMDEVIDQISGFLKEADDMLGKGHIPASINNYQDAKKIIPEYHKRNELYVALTGEKYKINTFLNESQITSKIRELVSQIHLTIIKGDNQIGFAGTKLPNKILLRASYKNGSIEIPVQHLPIKIKYINGERIEALSTDIDGEISLEITAVPTDETSTRGEVIFCADISAQDKKIQMPTTSLIYKVKASNFTFDVRVDDKSGSRYPKVEKMIAQKISENGYKISKDAKYIIEGHIIVVDEKTIDSPSGKQYFVESSAKFHLIKKSNRNILGTVSGKGRALDLKSREGAVTKSFNNIKISKKQFSAFLTKVSN